MPVRTWLDEAERALELVEVDPAVAARLATSVLQHAGSAEARSVAHRAVALAELYREQPTRAHTHLLAAIEEASAARHAIREGQARLTLVAALALTGAIADALAEADRAGALLTTEADLARVEAQRALAHRIAGHLDEAIACCDRAIERLEAAGDLAALAGALHNRGTLLAERGSVAEARRDLHRAAAISEQLGNHEAAATTAANLAKLVAVEGNVPAALAAFDHLDELPGPSAHPLTALDLAEAFLVARLPADAERAAARAAAMLEAADHRLAVYARLCEAQAVLLSGDLVRAEHLAGTVADQAGRIGQRAVTAQAELVALEARWRRDPHAVDSASAVTLAGALTSPEHLLVLGLMCRATDPGAARALLAAAAAAGASDADASGSVAVAARVAACAARGLLAELDGTASVALEAFGAATDLVGALPSALGGTELAVAAADAAAVAVTAALRLARSRGPAQLLAWTERSLGLLHRRRAVRLPDDAELRGRLAELRAAQVDGPPEAVGRAERRVRDRARQIGGASEPVARAPWSQVRSELGEACLVELTAVDGALVAILGSQRRRLAARELGAVEPLAALARLVLRRTRAAAVAADHTVEPALREALDAAARLDALLFGALALPDGPAVIVPGAWLGDVPWAALASLRDRPFTVAPSATGWLQAKRTGRPSAKGALVVAGPGLPHAAAEAAAIARGHRAATVLTGGDATVERVTACLAQADIAHLAVHGTLRHDNPLLSSLELHDGPLTAYDLELVHPLPSLVVLSACHGAASAAAGPGALIGLSSTLLRSGVATTVAAATEVRDDAMSSLMPVLHDRLRHGASVAEALAAVRAPGHPPAAIAAAITLLCLGSG